jgi:chromosomal replication initiation ATPase DnaA
VTRPDQLVLDLAARPALGREAFFVSPANELAVALVELWPDWPGPALALIGPEGAGKTHLAHVWATRSGAEVVPAEALAGLDPGAVPEGAAVALEDLDRLPAASRDRAEAAAFHLYNRLAAGGGALLVSGRGAPGAWGIRLPDLASRIGAAPVAKLDPPDDRLLAAILVKLFADRGVAVGPDLIGYLVLRMERSFQGAQALVAKLDARGLARRRRLNVRLAAEVLDER